jgi:tetratricopeptide (TPR) repeat protein/predicted Ser/Thr protein kinase
VSDTLQDSAPAEAAPTLQPGAVLGRYVVLSLLGQGGMSVVYLAYDPQLDRKVAIKLVRLEILGTTGKQRLLREAQALARLSSPYVVPVYDVETIDDQLFVAMEYVEGQTLRQWLNEPKPWKVTLRTLRDAGRGLAAAHAAGLVHRDFKPDNVLLGRDGRVRVLDFGLARTAADLASDPDEVPKDRPVQNDPLHTPVTRFGQVIGTPGYMAPEQASQGKTDARADQFAFCVVLFEALWGRKPFDESHKAAPTAETVVDRGDGGPKHLRAPQFVDPPRGANVPGWLIKVVRRGLSFDPAERYATMDQLLAELAKDPARKRRAIAATVLGVALVGGGLVFAQKRHAELCRGGDARMAELWNDGTRGAIRTAFARTNLPYAPAAADGFIRAVDDYARGWMTMHRDACEATRLRGEQSEELLDLRMACLDGRARELEALVGVMQKADADAVREASRASRALVPLSQCADVAALRAETPRPRDKQPAIEAIEKRQAEFKAQFDVGRFKAAQAMADGIVKDARAVGWAPLTAEAELGEARTWADLGEETKSIPGFRTAFATALAGRSDRTAAQSAVRLAQEYLYKSDLDQFRAWDAIAEASIARSGGDAHMEGFESILRCQALEVEGKTLKRFECLRSHMERFEKSSPPSDWEYSLLGLAAGESGHVEEAVDWNRRGVDYSTRVAGPLHPRTLEMRAYLCKALGEAGKTAAARKECEETLATARRVAADNEYLVSRIELYLGIVLRQAKEWDEARKHLLEAKKGVKPVGEVLTHLGEVELGAGHREAAIADFRAALAADEKEFPGDHPNLIVDLLTLGEAEGKNGLPLLERAAKIVERPDVNPLDAGQVWFALAETLGGGERAIALAEKAQNAYRDAPKSPKFDEERGKIDRWLAEHAKSSTAAGR